MTCRVLNKGCHVIAETHCFNTAVRTARALLKVNPGTLILVTPNIILTMYHSGEMTRLLCSTAWYAQYNNKTNKWKHYHDPYENIWENDDKPREGAL